MEKLKFWAVAFVFIAFMWFMAPDPASDEVAYPEGDATVKGTTTAGNNNPKFAPRTPEEAAERGVVFDHTALPTPMYASQAMQQLADSGAVPALKGIKYGEPNQKYASVSTLANPPTEPVGATTPATFRPQQIRFQTARGILPLIAGIADTEDLRTRGLMHHRKWPEKMHGVLFLIPAESIFTMWMKNTYLPLDMIFINRAGEVVHIHENAKTLSEEAISSEKPAQYVLEIPAGSAKLWQVAVGDKLILTK